MMGIDRFDPADLTRLLLQLACLHCSLHSKMSIIFAWIGTTPIRLAGIGFSIAASCPCIRGKLEGVRVHCLALGGVDLASSAGKMTMNVINAVAQFERDLLMNALGLASNAQNQEERPLADQRGSTKRGSKMFLD